MDLLDLALHRIIKACGHDPHQQIGGTTLDIWCLFGAVVVGALATVGSGLFLG